MIFCLPDDSKTDCGIIGKDPAANLTLLSRDPGPLSEGSDNQLQALV